MSVLSPLKEEISAIVGTPCLVQRDRVGRALFLAIFRSVRATAPLRGWKKRVLQYKTAAITL